MKMKHLITALAVLLIFFSAPLFARDHIVDNAGLLSDNEKALLEKQMEEIAAVYKFDLVIVTEKSIGAVEPMKYADDFFDNNGYGLGEARDGCLLLQVTGSRDYWFSASGRGIKVLNSSAFSKLENNVLKHLKNDNPSGAYTAFLITLKEFLVLESKGRSYNFFHEWNFVLVIAVWIIAFVIGFFIVQNWKTKMNTALPGKEADTYVVSNSLAFKNQSDRFLYSTMSKTKVVKSSSSSSVHTSSSGRSHSGRGGKY